MSLICWVPLISNTLNNQGLKNMSVTNNSATYSSSGGKLSAGCWSFSDGTKNGHGISIDKNFTDIGSNRSICAWVYPKGNHADYAGAIVSSGNWNSSRWSFGVERANGGFTGFDNGYSTYYSTSIPLNTWTHLCVTVADGVTKFYKNGVYLGEQSRGSGTVSSDASNTMIGRETYAGGYFGFNGSIQDVRIYDHCLTPQEVKEISKGLVAHYTLGSESVLPAITNYATNSGPSGWNNSGAASRSGNDTTKGSPLGQPVYSITTTTAGEQCITFGNPDVTNLKGKQVTASCWIYIVGSTIYNSTPYLRSNKYDNVIASFKYEGNGSINTWPKNKWIRVSGTGTVASDETGAYFCNYIGNSGEVRYYTGWQVELYGEATPYIAPGTSRSPGIIYDSSGYCYNTTINGAISPSTDTVRYKHCIKFNGSSYASCISPTAEAKTLSLWAYIGSSIPTYNILFADYKSKLSLGFYDSGTHLITSCSGTQMPVGDTSTVKKNAWNHFVVVNNGSRLLYINGSPVTMSSNNYWNHSSDLLMIGKRADANDGFTEKISDIRLYATALSADDISDLYKLGALIS